MAPLEPWEKVLVDADAYLATVHGQIPCTDCHGGQQAAEKDIAHTGLIAEPSAIAQETCGGCHPNLIDMYANSLHNTQQGYWTVIDARADASNIAAHENLEEMFDNHCGTCHTTCGECHVSQPGNVGGGLFNGHVFEQTPPMTRSCTACHGSRVGNEFLGKNEGIPGDVHFREGRMNCVDCHSGDQLHGVTGDCSTCHVGPEEAAGPMPANHRYAGTQSPSCEACHVSAATGEDGLEMHQAHGADLSCQVCHSVAYSSCDGCHVAISETSGKPFYETQATYLTFYIGRNAWQSFSRPYEFVTVRHIPVDPTSYSYYGGDLLPNFNLLPTWAYATPHNIQASTPQAETCNACHGNPDLFLTADKVRPEELEANLDIIIQEVPSLIEEP